MDFSFCSFLRERVFGEPLASNGLPLWLYYSGFQASCHNTNMASVRETEVTLVTLNAGSCNVVQGKILKEYVLQLRALIVQQAVISCSSVTSIMSPSLLPWMVKVYIPS
jgi:hypothetical protein